MASTPLSQARSFIVGLAGGSASGKSTFCEAFVNALKAGEQGYLRRSLSVEAISTDWYFLPGERIPRYTSPSTGIDTPDYNRPDSIDIERLLQDLDTRAQAEGHADVIIVEGLMVLQRADIRERLDLRLFIEIEGEVRALRRLVRNLGKTYDPTVKNDPQSIANYYLESAFVGHEKYVEPSKVYADLIVRGNSDFGRIAPMVAAVVRDNILD